MGGWRKGKDLIRYWIDNHLPYSVVSLSEEQVSLCQLELPKHSTTLPKEGRKPNELDRRRHWDLGVAERMAECGCRIRWSHPSHDGLP